MLMEGQAGNIRMIDAQIVMKIQPQCLHCIRIEFDAANDPRSGHLRTKVKPSRAREKANTINHLR